MFNTHFNHHQFRRFLVAFGSFFDDIQLRRTDDSGTEIQRMVVPLDYGPKDRWYTRLAQDPDFIRGIGTIVPRMSYELTGISYDGSRKLASLNHLAFPSPEVKSLARLYVGVPYVLKFDLSILTKIQQDGLQIVEQILPYFTPDLTFKMQTVPELGLIDMIPLTLLDVGHTDNYEGDFEHRRLIIWNLQFSMKVNFYGPVRQRSRIEEVVVDIYNSPLGDIVIPPEFVTTEQLDEWTMEDSSGHMATEKTPETYLSTGRVSRIDVVATNHDQDPTQPIQATTTITDDDADVKRGLTFTDEHL
jgi:hypothetical protein